MNMKRELVIESVGFVVDVVVRVNQVDKCCPNLCSEHQRVQGASSANKATEMQ